MKGTNIFEAVHRGERTFSLDANRVCIFISHQKDDATACRILAKFLMDVGIDIYFDEFDKSIDRNNPWSVVNSIRQGLNNSTHTLVVLSNNALKSKWMPWEVGYSYVERPNKIYAITLSELAYSSDLPEFFQILPVIRGCKSLLDTLSGIPINEESKCEIRWFSESSSFPYPLSIILSVDK